MKDRTEMKGLIDRFMKEQFDALGYDAPKAFIAGYLAGYLESNNITIADYFALAVIYGVNQNR